VLYALGSAGIQPSAVALMADLTSGRDRSAGMALVGAAFGVVTVLGPAVAAGLVGFGVLTPLIAVAAAAIVVAMMTKFQMVDAQRQKAEAMKESAPVSLPEGLPILLAVTFLAYVAVATLQQTAAFFIQDFTGTGAADAARLSGFAFVALAGAMLLVQGGLVQALKPAPHVMVGLGLPLAALGLGLYLRAPSYPWIIVTFAVMGAGFGLAQPGISARISLNTGADQQGGAAGLVQAAMAGGFVVGPLAGTLLYGIAPTAPLWLALGSLAAALLRHRPPQPVALAEDRRLRMRSRRSSRIARSSGVRSCRMSSCSGPCRGSSSFSTCSAFSVGWALLHNAKRARDYDYL
jgi:MFS family permease